MVRQSPTFPRRRGQALIYLTIVMPIMVGFCSFAVDYGRAEVDRTELMRAADAAARYGAMGLQTSSSAAFSWAIAAAASNMVDGSSVVLTNADVQVGVWNSATQTFTATASNPTAVQVTAQRTKSRGTAIPTVFAQVVGFASIDLHVTAVATETPGTSTVINVPGGADPWLAGMPNGTTANFTNQGWTDQAPTNSPILANGITLTAGKSLQFKFTGSVSYYPGTQPFDPDGDPGWIIDDYYAGDNGGAEHGIADINAPLTSVIGVFLNDNDPSTSAAPAALDFSTDASRNFQSISPQLKQPFFIGDGVMDDGVTLQSFVVPAGATRLYIGVMDGQQWSDNSGSLSTTVQNATIITSVK